MSEPEELDLGVDPWMRFDMWANRSWATVMRAADVAIENGATNEENIDHRVMALFHAAQLAKEFAEMVNPNGTESEAAQAEAEMVMSPEMIAEFLADDDE